MNICKECKYFKGSTYGEHKFHECLHLDCRNPVSGSAQTCYLMRAKAGACGIAGNHFELGYVGKVVGYPKLVKEV